MPVPDEADDLKELFRLLIASGAGRSVDENGLPDGEWTAPLLAKAISEYPGNNDGIELRTVQHWFETNSKGISAKNIYWLARIFGCGDAHAIAEWQLALSKANRKLSRKRKKITPNEPLQYAERIEKEKTVTHRNDRDRFSLAGFCDSVLSAPSISVPSTVFAVASALIFLSYLCGNHSFVFQTPQGYGKQIGYVWTANWTLVFIVFLPAYFLCASSVLNFWKTSARLRFYPPNRRDKSKADWQALIDANAYTFTLVFVLLTIFAGGVQWLSVRLLPLLTGEANYTTDWGSLALEHPEVISVPEAIVFTGLAYLAMCLFYFGFYAVLILLYLMCQDFEEFSSQTGGAENNRFRTFIDKVGDTLTIGLFRCGILGLMTVIVMKLQGSYMESYGVNILQWYIQDTLSVFNPQIYTKTVVGWDTPNHVASLLCALAVVFTFAMGIYHLRGQHMCKIVRLKLIGVFILLFSGYLGIGLFDGFTILLTIAMIVATYSLFDPKLRFFASSEVGTSQRVL